MSKGFLFSWLAALFISAGVLPSFSQPIMVGPDQEITSLSDAFDRAGDGDTVRVFVGLCQCVDSLPMRGSLAK